MLSLGFTNLSSCLAARSKLNLIKKPQPGKVRGVNQGLNTKAHMSTVGYSKCAVGKVAGKCSLFFPFLPKLDLSSLQSVGLLLVFSNHIYRCRIYTCFLVDVKNQFSSLLIGMVAKL